MIGYDNTINENLMYINNTIKDLITNKNKNQVLTASIEIFKIYNLPRNPKKGGNPPKDNKTKIFISLLKWLDLDIWLEILFTGKKNIIKMPINNQ